MLTVEEWMDVRSLNRQGHSVRAIARMTGYSRNTIKKLLTQPAPPQFRQPPRPSKLDPFKAYLTKRYAECPLSAVRLLAEIQPQGYTGSIDLLRRFLAPFKAHRRAEAKATVRFETPPGQQGQVDWASCGTFRAPDGSRVKIYAFVLVLGFSRMLYVEFTTSMALPVFLACHQHAFAFLGGWPQELLYDNMAQVRLPHSAAWNPLFRDFAQHYGFTPRTCRVRRPRTKGKVERAIRYVQDGFLAGRVFTDLADLNSQGYHWLCETANVRVHATTGQRPVDLLPQEGLTPLAAITPYPLSRRSARKVTAEAVVHLDRATYSVAPEYVGQTVLVEEDDQQIRIRSGERVLAAHRRAQRPGEQVLAPEHVAALWQLCAGRAAPPPAALSPAFQVTFQEGVARTPLSVYEQLAGASGTPEAAG